MVVRKLLILCLAFMGAGYGQVEGQGGACTTLGQTPSTAFPVCGTSNFVQQTVPQCNNHGIPVRCNDGASYTDINPFWYKFTCFKSGTLGFQINPDTESDDYDWQLFDVTGVDPNTVYTDASLFVSGNWSSNPGSTGAGNNGNGSINCAGPAYPNQNSMPVISQGRSYLLLVSHYTKTQSGYTLTFSGGTASITDTTPPRVASAQPSCDGTKIRVMLNKRMQCSSLASDGSDFTISPAVPIKSVAGNSCSSSFDMDSVTLVLGGALPPGSYTLTVKKGTDQNTLLDNCGTQVPEGDAVSFVKPAAPLPTPLDSVAPPGCSPKVLKLVFSKGINCSTIAANGSDFTITGPQPVTITGASGNCDADGLTPVILLQLSAPIVTGGVYTVTLKTGSDGNTVVDECGQTTPAGQSISLVAADTVSAVFSYQIMYGCRSDTIAYTYQEKNGVNQWQWVFDKTDTVNGQNPVRFYPVFGQKTAELTVSNGVCTSSSLVTINLDNGIKAAFEAPNIICPKDYATFKNNSTGTLNSWNWDFGDGTGSNLQTPADHLYPMTGIETKYPVRLIVSNGPCFDTAVQAIDVLRSCYIAVPSAFTPNGDGVNDYLYPLNAFKADNLQFRVFNRFGEMVFQSADWQKKWDGTVNGHPAPAGTYVWMLHYIDRDTGKAFFQKGTSILIR